MNLVPPLKSRSLSFVSMFHDQMCLFSDVFRVDICTVMTLRGTVEC